MGAPRVLVIYKKSVYRTYVLERKSSRIRRLLEAQSPAVHRILRAHRAHQETLQVVYETLHRLGVQATFRFRRDVGETSAFDLVVTVGGDGTLLWASHFVGSAPVLCVNSAPNDSVGFFAGATQENVRDVLAKAVLGKLRETPLSRMAAWVDGERLENRVLNDVLFCHVNPAAMSRYILRRGRRSEEQRSSGVWIGPAAGSTAAQKSAGGRVLRPTSKVLQYVVREPYESRGVRYRLKSGLVRPGERLSLLNTMHEARLYVDGPYRVHRLQLGQEVVIALGDEPLRLLGFGRRI